MNVAFHTFQEFHGRRQIGSSRIRAKWLINHWPGAELYVPGKSYDIEIFQKVYWTKRAEQTPALKILDICDPDWVENDNVLKMAKLVDGIAFPTSAFNEFFKGYIDKPMKIIRDRIDFNIVKQHKIHSGVATKCVWFGYSHNQDVLQQVIPALRKFNLVLTIISDGMRVFITNAEDKKYFNFVKYDEKTVNDDIIKYGDFVLLPPQLPNDFGKVNYKRMFKSDNKTTLAWGLGMPVANFFEDIEQFVDEKLRIVEADLRRAQALKEYDVRLSIMEYLDLIRELS